jgi:hypothetical protein
MKPHFLIFCTLSLVLALILSGCSGKATPASSDSGVGTTAAELMDAMLTETAHAVPLTPTFTLTPKPHATPTAAGTPAPIAQPVVINFAGCWYGPGTTYTLESNISKGKKVQILGVGSVAGWYIIYNPYFHQPCWIAASDLQIDPRMNIAKFPVMTPGH